MLSGNNVQSNNYSIEHYSFTCTRFHGSKYYYILPIFQLKYTAKMFQVLLFNTNNSI